MVVKGWIALAAVLIIALFIIILAVILGRSNSDWCNRSTNGGDCEYYEENGFCYCIDAFKTANSINQTKDLGLYERSEQQCKTFKGSLAVADDKDLLIWLAKRMYAMGVDNALVALHKMTSTWYWMEDELASNAGDLVWKPEFPQDPEHTIAMVSVETVNILMLIDGDDEYNEYNGRLYLNYDHYLEKDRSYQWYGFRTSDNIFSIDKHFVCKYDSESDLKIDALLHEEVGESDRVNEKDRCFCSSPEKIELSTAGDSETLQSPGYPQNYCSDSNCRWIVVIPDGYAIKLDWLDFSTEHNMDMVYIYDGETDDSPLLASCTGSMCTEQQSTGNKMLIHFASDHVSTDVGFKASVTAVETDPCLCSTSTSILLANLHDSYALESPQYPKHYCMRHHCGWTISAPSNLGLQVIWNRFDTENGKDSVFLYDGDRTDGVLMKDCSGSSCTGVISTTNKVNIQFISDDIPSDNVGFQATITVVKNYCDDKHESPTDGVVNYSSLRNDGRAAVGSNATLTCGDNSKIVGSDDQTSDTVICKSPNWNRELGTCAKACRINWLETDDYTNITYCKPKDPNRQLHPLTSPGESLLVQKYDFVSKVKHDNQEELSCSTDGLWMPKTTPSIHCAKIEPKILIIGGYIQSEDGSAELDRSMELFYPNNPSLNRAPDTMIDEPRSYFASTLLADGRVMFMGGFDRTAITPHLRSCEIYNPKTNNLVFCPPLTIARMYLAAATLESTVYACGGTTEQLEPKKQQYDQKSCEYFNGDMTWQETAPMLVQRARFAMVAIHGQLLAIGGYNRVNRGLSSVEKYDPKTGQWLFVAPMPSARSDHGAAVLDGNVVVCGGINDYGDELFSCEQYNIQTNTWGHMQNMREARSDMFNLLSTGYSLVALGSNIERSDGVEVFDPETNKWSVIENIKFMPRFHFSAVLIP